MPWRGYRGSMARDLGKRLLPGARTWDRHQVVDVLVAVVFGMAGEVQALIDAHGQPYLLATASLTGPVLAGLLLVRRKRPLLTMSVFMAVAVAGSVVQALVVPAAGSPNQVVPIFAIMVMSYSLGAFGSRRDLLLGLPQPLVAVVIIDRLQPTGQSVPGAVAYFAAAVVGAAALGGRLIYGRQKLLKTLAGQRQQLDIQHAMQTRTALAAERLQLAGQLHEELVAGLNSLMTEADAAGQQDAGRQAAAVAAIETRARALLAETRKVVVSLAAADSARRALLSRPPRPTPTLRRTGPMSADRQGQPPPAASSTAITWSALAAAVVGTWLLLQVRTAPSCTPARAWSKSSSRTTNCWPGKARSACATR